MKQLFCDGWSFLKTDLSIDLEQVVNNINEFKPVLIPHDWLIFSATNLYEDSRGWYLKSFEKPEIPSGGHVFLTFEGVYMDSVVYINRMPAFEWKYGYSSFTFEITEFLKQGSNEIIVSVTHRSPNSRWYSGAGIYRKVYLETKGETYFEHNGIYVHSAKKENNDFTTTVEADVVNASTDMSMRLSLYKKDGAIEYTNPVVSHEYLLSKAFKNNEGKHFSTSFEVKKPSLWNVDSPSLYILKAELRKADRALDTEEIQIGFREFTFSPERGFLINGEKLKLNGSCEHHDLGLFGAAVDKDALYRELCILRKMGVNAIRTSHNMPSVELLELCDEMGFIVDDEAFDMWESPKTTYDYARFFKEWSARDVRSWVTRDRNRVCVAMWSIGNEIGDTHASAHGQEITEYLMNEVLKYDPYRNAVPTIGSNYMPWENAQKCADILKVAGYNYAERLYNGHHEAHPDWVIYGSETASVVSSRGVYRFTLSNEVMSEIDEQCSALGNSVTSWGARCVEDLICNERDHDFSLGQFIWSGFDYIGEPTPYHTKNSYFGQIDTAGFLKDSAYVFRSFWLKSPEPLIHLYPYWDFNEGQNVQARITSDLTDVELFLNGQSLGKKHIDRAKGMGRELVPTYDLKYNKGVLEAVGYDASGKPVVSEKRYSFGDTKYIWCGVENVTADIAENEYSYIFESTADNPDACSFEIPDDGKETYFIDIMTKDADGYFVENAMDYFYASASDNAEIIGMDNGDSTDYDEYRCSHRKLFNGRLLLVVRRLDEKPVRITVSRDTVNIPVRKIDMTAYGTGLEESAHGLLITKQTGEVRVKADVHPFKANGYSLKWFAVNDKGIEVNFVRIDNVTENEVRLQILGDGDFCLRCVAIRKEKVTVISQLEFRADGFGKAFYDPYEFVCAGLYDKSVGSIGNGIEKGISFARDGKSGVLFKKLDFGEYGSDEITIWMFAMTGDKFPVEVYDGDPENGGTLLTTLDYQQRPVWNEYIPQTFKLGHRLKNVHDLCFMMNGFGFHFKGFEFVKINKSFEKLGASDLKSVSGDSYELTEDEVKNIGNNVTLTIDNLDLEEGASKVTVYGSTDNEVCSIRLMFTSADETQVSVIDFSKDGGSEQTFELEKFKGRGKLDIIFLPGSKFNFSAIRFIK